MPAYKIDYLHKNVSLSSIVNAINKKNAIIHSGINEDQIFKVARVFFNDFKIKNDEQLLILTEIYSAISSGENVRTTLFNTLKNYYPNKQTKIDIFKSSSLSLSDLLNKFNFNSVAITIIKAGEHSGDIKTAILEARNYITLVLDLKKSTSSILTKILPILSVALVMLIGLPTYFFNSLKDILNLMQANTFTSILFFIGSNYLYILTALLLIVFLVITLKDTIWSKTKKFYLFKPFYDLSSYKKGISFLSVYKTLFKNGIEERIIVNSYQTIDSQIANQLGESMDKGISLSNAVTTVAGFNKDFAQKMSTIIAITNKDAKNIAFGDLLSILIYKIDNITKKIKTIATILTFIIAIFIIFAITFGIYFPMLNTVR